MIKLKLSAERDLSLSLSLAIRTLWPKDLKLRLSTNLEHVCTNALELMLRFTHALISLFTLSLNLTIFMCLFESDTGPHAEEMLLNHFNILTNHLHLQIIF